MYWVFFGEADGKRAFKGVKVCYQIIDQGGAACALEEEDSLGIFMSKGFALRELPLGAGILRFSRIIAL